MAKESFGNRLSKLRKEKGLTQNDIADKVGVTSQAVSKWENDQATPDIDILIKLSEIFEISLDELLGKETQKTFLNPAPTKKEFDKMTLKIRVLDAEDGDTVNVNLPLALVKAFIDPNDGHIRFMKVNDNADLSGIDFREIMALVEQGVIGEIVSIDSKKGDKVSIFVE